MDPLSPLVPVARVAAIGVVAAAGSLAAVHVVANPAASTTSPSIAAKLVATPKFPPYATHTTSSATFTDPAEIAQVLAIINALPPAPTGVVSCPMDVGSGLRLDFESTDGTLVEQATMAASGCGGTTITINGEQQPAKASGRDTIQRIQRILGTSWQLAPVLPR
jgi:hypothetical protein